MAPLDWDKLMALDVESLAEDTDEADDIFSALTEYEPEGDTQEDSKKLAKLFKICQSLMMIKQYQVELAEEELTKKAQTEGTTTASRDVEIEELRSELEALRREKKDVERGLGASGGAGMETRFLRDELHEFENQIQLLQKELKEKDRLLVDEKQMCERYMARAEETEKELRDVRRDYEQVRDDMRDYQRQLQAQRDSILSKRDEDMEVKDKILSKNKLLFSAMEENRNLAEHNVKLEKEIDDLKSELKDGQLEIEKTTDEYLKIKSVMDQADSTIDGLRRENEMLKSQVTDLLEQNKSKADADDEIMVQVAKKVEDWKEILAVKEQRIYELQDQILQLREQLLASNMDSEKTSVAVLTKAVEERDKQIETLRRRLDEASGDLEANAALMEDVRGELGKSGRGPGDKHVQKISNLQSTLKSHESHLREAETKVAEAEDDARAKDKQLNELLERMRQYEEKIYGLPEAVSEIKQLKEQCRIKDRNSEELTQYINKCEMQINDLYDEAEALRDKLGLGPKEPIDLGEFRKKKSIRLQEDRALNRVLQKEVERLEEERLESKQTIRKLAQATGQRAVALGLSSEDMVAVDQFMEELKEKNVVSSTATHTKAETEKDELRLKALQLDKEVETNQKKIDRLSQENAVCKAKNKQLEEENSSLEKGIKEIHEAIKEQSGSQGDGTIACPTLDRMLAAIEAKNITGSYDATLYLKAQCDNLTGRNEELRKELREVRWEASKANVEQEKAMAKVETMCAEIKTLREVGAGGGFQSMPLPEGMAVTSADVIANLNEHMVQILQELSLKEDMILKMEVSLENYRRKFAVMRHQQGILYQDFMEEKKQYDYQKKTVDEELKKLEGQRETDMVRLQEFDRLLDTLAQDDVEVRRRVSDMTRKSTVLRVNEKALTRRYNALQDIETNVRKENNKLKAEMGNMQAAVAERLGYLQRYKDMAAFKMAALQKSLDDSVPSSELDRANKQYTELVEKYRDMLEKSNSLVAKTEENSGYEVEVKRLHDENNYLKQELGIEKEKLHTLEAAFDQMRKQGMASSKDLTNNEVLSISKKLTTLEMKELNERQRADHATRMYEQQKTQLRNLEDRNFELEAKFAEVTRMNIDGQRVERELRDELANSVTKAVSDHDRSRIADLEKTEANLRNETSKLKDVSEVALMQVRGIEAQRISHEKELTSLRQQLIDFQAQSDEKTVIGKLHRHIVQLQVSEGTALRKLEDASKKIRTMEAHIMRTEQKLDEKEGTIFHNRQEAHSKAKYLKHTIQDLRRKFTGAVPLPQQEKFAEAMVKLQQDKACIEEDLRKTNIERQNIEDKLHELELQHTGLQDLIATLKDGRGAAKVVEWHSKMEAIRLEDLRYRREIDRTKHQLRFQEGIIKKHEGEVLSLEEEKIRLTKEFEERELEWEQREVELERIISNLERQQAEIAGAASQFEDAIGALPDKNLPVAQQLDEAVSTIKRNVKLILDAKAQSANIKKRLEEADALIREKERECLQRDKVITELRLRMPASAERDEMILKATAAAQGAGLSEEDYESKKAVHVAQSTVGGLQARIAQKEESLNKYQELLKQAREDMSKLVRNHQEELRIMQEKLHSKNDAAFNKFKQNVRDSLSKPMAPVPSNDQLKKLNELEDIVADQDNSIQALRDKLNQSRQETQDWKYRHQDAVRQAAEEKEGIVDDHQQEINEIQEKMKNLSQQLSDKTADNEVLEAELEQQKEANARAPTTTMKNMIERLKNQLALKEKQHQALSKALMDLRADMVNQASSDVMANAEHSAIQQTVQRAVDKKTKDYQERIEEFEVKHEKLKREFKKIRERDSSLNTELEETRHELVRKESQLKKVKGDKQRLEKENEEFEKKVERMGTMAKQKGPSEAGHHETEELRRKNRLLQEELQRSKHQAEKPYEQQVKEKDSGEVVAKWEENKKWQKMVDRLKSRIKDKEQDLEKMSKSNELLKNGLERANKDKEQLEVKLRSAQRSSSAVESPVVARTVAAPLGAAPSGVSPHVLEDLKRKVHSLEEENGKLRKQIAVGPVAAFEEVQLRNKFLTEKLAELEQQAARRLRASQEGTIDPAAYHALYDKEQNLQKEVIKLSEENIELRFEVEQANIDIPRLKSRLADLQGYCDLLKVERDDRRETLSASARSLTSSLGTASSGNLRRIGDSGKSTRDLEKTIALLKKVVERTQAENQALKKAPGVISAEQMKVLQTENSGLKTQLEELRQKMGASLSERYQTQQKGTARMMSDYESLRKDLMKEIDTNEKLRIQIRQQELTIEGLEKILEEKDKATESGDKKKLRSSLDSKDYKAVVENKILQDKNKAFEEDNEKKTKMLSDVKVLLREAAEREQNLLQEKEKLQSQVIVLKKFPPGTKVTESELMEKYQLARLTIDRLEKEKKELLNELTNYRKRSNPNAGGPNDVGEDEILLKIQSHDQIMTKNVDLSTKLKATELECDKLKREVTKLKKELENFGPEFFEEIEDLKYNYRESIQKNVQYEEQLGQLSQQFGIDIPGL